MRIYRDVKERKYSYVNMLNDNESYNTLIALFKYNKYNDNHYKSFWEQLDIDKSTYLDIIKDDNDFLDFFIGV
jgi:hypothetical protein